MYQIYYFICLFGELSKLSPPAKSLLFLCRSTCLQEFHKVIVSSQQFLAYSEQYVLTVL